MSRATSRASNILDVSFIPSNSHSTTILDLRGARTGSCSYQLTATIRDLCRFGLVIVFIPSTSYSYCYSRPLRGEYRPCSFNLVATATAIQGLWGYLHGLLITLSNSHLPTVVDLRGTDSCSLYRTAILFFPPNSHCSYYSRPVQCAYGLLFQQLTANTTNCALSVRALVCSIFLDVWYGLVRYGLVR